MSSTTKIIKKITTLSLFDKVLIFSGILVVFIFAVIFFRKASYITITVKVNQDSLLWQRPGTQAWFSQMFYPGMVEKSGMGKVKAKVLEVRSYDYTPDKKSVYLKLKIQAVYNRSSNQYIFKGQPVLVGSTVRLYLDKVLVDGLVTFVDGVTDPRQKETLIVNAQVINEDATFPETQGVPDYLDKALTVGQEIKDSQGNLIAKIIDKRSEPAKKITTNSQGKLITQYHPLRKDIYLTLEISALKLGLRHYFLDDIPIFIGGEIPLHFDKISILPVVTHIKLTQ